MVRKKILQYEWRICPNLIALYGKDEGCDLVECPHNVLWTGLHLKKNILTGAIPTFTEVSIEFKNCMTLQRGHDLTLEDVGTMWGITRERVRQLEEKALRKIYGKTKVPSHEFRKILGEYFDESGGEVGKRIKKIIHRNLKHLQS